MILVYGTEWCGDCRRSKRVLDARAVAYRWIDVDADQDSAELITRLNRGRRTVPTIVFPDGSFLAEPSDADLTAKLTALGS